MLDTSFIIGYIALVLLIGYFSSQKQTGDRFMIMGRKLGLFGFVSSVVASLFGASALVVYTAYVFEFGIGALFGFLGIAIGFTVFGLSAHKLRKWAHENEFHTMADFFHFIFGPKLGNLIAVIMAISLILWILKQFIVGTQVLVAISGYTYEASLLISALIVLVYLLLGGFRSVIKTDIFQYLIILFFTFAVGLAMAHKVELPLSEIMQSSASPSIIASFLMIGLLVVWYSPDVWQRIYAAENDQIVKKGLIISGFALVLIGIGITLIGFSARVAYPSIDSSQALVYGITHLLPPGILGIGIVLIFAAVMSSADTLIFVLATSVAKDFIRPLKGGSLSHDELMHYTRISLVGIILIAVCLAYFLRSVVDIALVNTGFGMSMAPAIIGSFRWKLKKRAALISVVSGLLWTFMWIVLGHFSPEAMVSPILISTITLIIFQKLLKH